MLNAAKVNIVIEDTYITEEDLNEYEFTEEELRFNKLVATTSHIVGKNAKQSLKESKNASLNKVKKANRYGN